MAHHFERPPAVDKVPAFVGLVLGAVAIALLLFGVYKWTDARFDARKPGAAAGQH